MVNRKSKLSKLEILILNSVRSSLDRSVIKNWDQQVQKINKIQRLPGNVETNFYRMKGGKPQFEESIAFPNRVEELLVARVTVESFDRKTLIANVWSVKGFLFSIEYNTNNDYFEELLGMYPKSDVTSHCELVVQLEQPKAS